MDGRGGGDGDALVIQGVLDRGGDLRLLERGEPAGRLGDGDPGSEPGEQLRHFQADRVPADHQHGLRQPGQLHRRRRGQVPGLLKPAGRRYPRRRAGRDQVMAGLDADGAAVSETDL